MVKLNKSSIFVITETQFAIQSQVMQQTNCTESLHVDETKMRSFQTELFSSFRPSTYAGHVNLAAAKPWQFTPNWRYGSTVELIILFFVLKISFLPKYLVIYYDYIVKWCSIAGYFLNVSFKFTYRCRLSRVYTLFALFTNPPLAGAASLSFQYWDRECNCCFFFISTKFNGLIFNTEYAT